MAVDMKTILRQEMDRQHIVDPTFRAGIAAIAGGENNFEMKPEVGYAHTSNARIRTIFGSRVAALSDAQLDALKVNPVDFFNRVYSLAELGNTEPGDGFKFRGRGPIQLTGRFNYTKYGKLAAHPEITNNPEIMERDAGISMAVCIAYMKDRYKGGGWEEIKRDVGNNIPDIEATKNRLFRQYLGSGEFGPMPGSDVIADTVEPNSPSSAKPNLARAMAIQVILQPEYTGAVDGDLGKNSQAAYDMVAALARKELRT